MRTRETLPRQWAQTHENLAEAYLALQDWPNAVISYVNVLHVYPDYKKAYQKASYLYHEELFQFPQAFAINQQWLERHPDDLGALSDYAEKHFTTGRFAACAERLTVLLANPAVEPRLLIPLRALEIANLLALGHTALVPDKIDALIASIIRQPEDFKATWSFAGTTHFISQHAQLAPYRPWLQQFFGALTGTDRQTMLTALQAARATFPAVVK